MEVTWGKLSSTISRTVRMCPRHCYCYRYLNRYRAIRTPFSLGEVLPFDLVGQRLLDSGDPDVDLPQLDSD